MTKGSGKGKNKSAKLEVRPFMVKNYLWVFVNSMINNPTFDSQVRYGMPSNLMRILVQARMCLTCFRPHGFELPQIGSLTAPLSAPQVNVYE